MRVVVIGGDAAGGSAASTIKRQLKDAVEVVVLEQQPWTSYSACGIPYWIAGQTDGLDALIARTPEQHRANGLDLHTNVAATAIDPQRRTVSTGEHEYSYDHLVLATGATPVRPPIPGLDLPGIHNIHTLQDGLDSIADLADQRPVRALVVGGGYVGIEMAEACLDRGLNTTLIDMAEEPMTSLDPDMGRLVHESLVKAGVEVRMRTPLEEFLADGDGRVTAARTGGGEIPTDVVFLGMGVRPRTELALAAGVTPGHTGAIETDLHQRVLGLDGHVWAAGDCVQTYDRVSSTQRYLPLGTHANKQGRILGMNIAGTAARFAGVVGTAITKFMDTEIARTGLGEHEATELGHDVRTATITATTASGYMPQASPITVKLIGEPGGRLLGGQIVGGPGSGKRIDVIATALFAGLSVPDILGLDLAYVPPLSPVWDPVQAAARVLLGRLR